MPSNYTPLGFNKQASGENENTWGDILNDEAIDLIDEAIRGRAGFTLSGSKTLTSTQGESSEARRAYIHVTGGTGGTVTVPDLSKPYIVTNEASGDVTITAGGSTNVTVAPGETAQVVADGLTAVRKVRYSDFGGARLTGVGNPTENDDAANKLYVDAQAFSAALPSGASAGQVVQYDGTNAGWAGLGVDDVSGAAPEDAPSLTGNGGIAGNWDVGGDASITGDAAVGGELTLSGGLDQTGGSAAGVTALAALDIDVGADDFHTKAISASSAFTFSGFKTGKAHAWVVQLTISSAAVPSWPASVVHPLGIDPSASLGNGTHYLGFITMDGGTNVLMIVLAKAAA